MIGGGAGSVALDPALLGRLLPLYLRIDAAGTILSHGPLVARLAGGDLAGGDLAGRPLWQVYGIRQPARARRAADLVAQAGGRVRLTPPDGGADLRGMAFALP
ncbi:MAG: hypothetical protein RIR62_914, partial [Pseudomonadota bacterium]